MIMRKLYSVSYDLRQPGRDYEDLYVAIQNCGSYFHALESTWFVRSELSANDIYERLKDHKDANDHVVISEVNSVNQQGWMMRTFWEWISDESKPSVK